MPLWYFPELYVPGLLGKRSRCKQQPTIGLSCKRSAQQRIVYIPLNPPPTRCRARHGLGNTPQTKTEKSKQCPVFSLSTSATYQYRLRTEIPPPPSFKPPPVCLSMMMLSQANSQAWTSQNIPSAATHMFATAADIPSPSPSSLPLLLYRCRHNPCGGGRFARVVVAACRKDIEPSSSLS